MVLAKSVSKLLLAASVSKARLIVSTWYFMFAFVAKLLTGFFNCRKSLVVGQSGVSKICYQTSVSSKCV